MDGGVFSKMIDYLDIRGTLVRLNQNKIRDVLQGV